MAYEIEQAAGSGDKDISSVAKVLYLTGWLNASEDDYVTKGSVFAIMGKGFFDLDG